MADFTRHVELWFDNDQGMYNETRGIARDARRGNPYPTTAAADALKEWFQETYVEPMFDAIGGSAGPAQELMEMAVQSVDWEAIVKGYAEEDGEEEPLPEVPEDWPVQPLDEDEVDDTPGAMQCGSCLRWWDNSVSTSITPVPSARCPFENFHAEA